MATLSLKKKEIPFLLGGRGELSIDTGPLRLDRRIPEDAPALLNVGFSATGQDTLTLGQASTVNLAVSTATSVSLTPVFSRSTGAAAKLLQTNGVADFFRNEANHDKGVLALDERASARAAGTASYSYSALKATTEINTGADGGFTYLRALDKSLPIAVIVPSFFTTVRLPEQVTGPPEPGEAISLRYGGYLRVAAEVSAGYELVGTKSVSLGQLALSEKYGLSIVGKVGLSAGIAGRFSVLVTAASDLPGWARVQVRRQRSRDMKIAADVSVAFDNQLDHLPSSANEFLGAALGVNAKSFLTLLRRAHELSDYENFTQAVDGLARTFVGELIGKAFDKLESSAEFTRFLARVNQVVTSYDEVGDRAITLFDRYFDEVHVLTAFLDRLVALEAGALDTLRKDLDPQLWNILSQLTDGDPLGFLLGSVTVKGVEIDSLPELKARASATLDLIRNAAHAEIRNVIQLAKSSFRIDALFREAAKLDTVDELRAVANQKVGLFVSRLVGRTLDSATNLKEAFKEVRAVLDSIDAFGAKFYGAFKAAASSSYQVALHAEYSRASEAEALVDVLINAAASQGPDLLALAGRGDFERILGTADTDLVRLREGVLTHRTRRESAFKVNILGWHLNYQYEGFDRVITETEQRLVPSDQGITVLTTATLEVDRARKRRGEETHVNFLLRALGESARAVKSDDSTLGYLIDTLASLSARYELALTDEDTTEVELDDYLAFARDVELDKQGATLEVLGPLLPRAPNGGFGAVSASYEVRFARNALAALLSVKQLSAAGEGAIRNAMRRMVLSNYLKSAEQHDVAFAYATPAVHDLFSREGFASFTNHSMRVFPVSPAMAGIAAPSQVELDRMELNVLVTLYNIENSMIAAIRDLYGMLNAGKPMSPSAFEQKLGKFGNAMKSFDDFDQTTSKHGIGTNSLFAMFDALVRIASADRPSHVAVLRLKSEANGRTVEKVFLSDEAAGVT